MKIQPKFTLIASTLAVAVIFVLVLKTLIEDEKIVGEEGQADLSPRRLEGSKQRPATVNTSVANGQFLVKHAGESASPTNGTIGKRRLCAHCYYEPYGILPEPKLKDGDLVERVKDVFGADVYPFKQCIHLATILCGTDTEEAQVMLKSAVLLSKTCLVFHIFAEDSLQSDIHGWLNSWSDSYTWRIHAYIYPITFPRGEDKKEWSRVADRCVTQKLFLPSLLPEIDSLLYVDTEVIVIKPIEDIWGMFSRFNATQIAALSPDSEDLSSSFYERYGRHPYPGKTGVHTGVILMNLTRMREFRWSNRMTPLYTQYRCRIVWPEQDLVNLIFYYHPDRLYEMPCEWNYRQRHCVYGNNCHRIGTEGIAVLHASTGTIHDEMQPPYLALYETFRDFQLGESILRDLIRPLRRKWWTANLVDMPCTQAIRKPILSTLARYIEY